VEDNVILRITAGLGHGGNRGKLAIVQFGEESEFSEARVLTLHGRRNSTSKRN